MDNESSICSIANRTRETIADSQSAISSSSSTSSTSIPRHNTKIEMPTTREQLERLISTRVTAALASAASRGLFNNRVHEAEQVVKDSDSIVDSANVALQNRELIQEVAKSEYRLTTALSIKNLKANRLIEDGGVSKKRKEMILTILEGENLLSLLNGTRLEPVDTIENPTGYTRRKLITMPSGEEIALDADDHCYYQYDSRRLYIAMTIAISENLQFMFPQATVARNGKLLWELAIKHLFGNTSNNILEATDKLRRWHIDPSKNVKTELLKLSQLIERVNETLDSKMSESSILAIIYNEIVKDPREGLRIIAHYASITKPTLDNFITILNESPCGHPFNSKTKMNELGVSVNKGYCNKFQVGKCTFGDKCRYRHKIDPDYKKKDKLIVAKNYKDNNNKDKSNNRKPNKDGAKLYTPNSFNNRVVGPPKGETLNGQPSRYSNQQQKLLKIFIQNNNMLLDHQNDLPTPPLQNSTSWRFDQTTQSHNNQRIFRM